MSIVEELLLQTTYVEVRESYAQLLMQVLSSTTQNEVEYLFEVTKIHPITARNRST